jgi:hypothetical protein
MTTWHPGRVKNYQGCDWTSHFSLLNGEMSSIEKSSDAASLQRVDAAHIGGMASSARSGLERLAEALQHVEDIDKPDFMGGDEERENEYINLQSRVPGYLLPRTPELQAPLPKRPQGSKAVSEEAAPRSRILIPSPPHPVPAVPAPVSYVPMAYVPHPMAYGYNPYMARPPVVPMPPRRRALSNPVQQDNLEPIEDRSVILFGVNQIRLSKARECFAPCGSIHDIGYIQDPNFPEHLHLSIVFESHNGAQNAIQMVKIAAFPALGGKIGAIIGHGDFSVTGQVVRLDFGTVIPFDEKAQAGLAQTFCQPLRIYQKGPSLDLLYGTVEEAQVVLKKARGMGLASQIV